MQLSRAATMGLVAVAVLAMAGTGFAAFTATAYLNGSGSAGTVGPLVWGPNPSPAGFAPNDVCTVERTSTSLPGDTLDLVAGNLAPGDVCAYGDSLTNEGSLPASTTEQITLASGGLCGYLIFADNFFTPSVVVGAGGQTATLSHVIAAGGNIQWAGFISLSSSAGPSVMGESCDFMVTVTGAAGT